MGLSIGDPDGPDPRLRSGRHGACRRRCPGVGRPHRRRVSHLFLSSAPFAVARSRIRLRKSSARRAYQRLAIADVPLADPMCSYAGEVPSLLKKAAELASPRRSRTCAASGARGSHLRRTTDNSSRARVATRRDGKTAAASVVSKRLRVLINVFEYAIEREILSTDPLTTFKWQPPKASTGVDKRSVVKPVQARTLLNAVRDTKRSGPRWVAFFGLMYFAGLPQRKRRS